MLQGDEILRDQHPLKTGPDDQERLISQGILSRRAGPMADHLPRINYTQLKC